MTKKKLHFGKMIMTWAIAQSILGEFTLASANSTRSLSPARADSSKPVNALPRQERSRFNRLDFSDIGRPRKRRGGGSRGSCSVTNKPPLTALVPDTGVGLTVAKSPTFWFYVPYTLTPNYSVEFVLKDNQDNTVYKNKALGKGTPPGIVSLRLPSTVLLKAGKDYDWYFLVYCDAQNEDKFVYVNGLVRRVERPVLEKQSVSVSGRDRMTHYKAEDIWYEALTELAQSLSVSPQDAKTRQNWSNLLQSVGLEQLALEPFVSCCILGN
jgi:Domain of Unknown Function (DUF928)